MKTFDLKSLGAEIGLVDRGIMDLVQKRMQLAKQVGVVKYLKGDEIFRPSVEDLRIANIKQYADSIGLNPNLAATLLYALIQESCKAQMIQLQHGNLLKENIVQLAAHGNEPQIVTESGTYNAFSLAPRALSAKDRDHVFDLIYPVAQSAFGQRHSEMFANDVRAHALDHTEILVVQDVDGKTIAFCIWDTFADYIKPIVYLAGMCVLPAYQKGGLGPVMIQRAIDLAGQQHPSWGYVVLRTQNWAMQKSMGGIASKFGTYCKFGDTDIAEDMQSAAKAVADKNHDHYFEPANLISRKIYGSCLYGAPKNFREGFVGLNVDEGDAAYCVWRR